MALHNININVKTNFGPYLIIRHCYDKYSNNLDYTDIKLINGAYMKFANICVLSIKNYI